MLEDESAAYAQATRSGLERRTPRCCKEIKRFEGDQIRPCPYSRTLWDDAAMIAGFLSLCRDTQLEFKVLRRGMLRFWKRQLTVEYGGWLRSHRKKWVAAPSVTKAGLRPYKHYRVNQQDVAGGYQVYRWAPDGRLNYQKW